MRVLKVFGIVIGSLVGAFVLLIIVALIVSGRSGAAQRSNGTSASTVTASANSPSSQDGASSPAQPGQGRTVVTTSVAAKPQSPAAPSASGSQVEILDSNIVKTTDSTLYFFAKLKNTSSAPAYRVTLTATAFDANGAVSGSGSSIPMAYLGAGDLVGFKTWIDNPAPYTRTELKVTADGRGFAKYAKLDPTGTALRPNRDGFNFAGRLVNSTQGMLDSIYYYVWYMDASGKILYEDWSGTSPSSLKPNDALSFDYSAASPFTLPGVKDITQADIYAVGEVR